MNTLSFINRSFYQECEERVRTLLLPQDVSQASTEDGEGFGSEASSGDFWRKN